MKDLSSFANQLQVYMGRLLAIDYGIKRVGIAVTDPDQIIANSLTVTDSSRTLDFLREYMSHETVDAIIIGEPKTMNNRPSEVEPAIAGFIQRLRKAFPTLEIHRFDERFTSKMAFQTMIDSGIGRKARQNKSLVDAISATIILQSYMESIKKY